MSLIAFIGLGYLNLSFFNLGLKISAVFLIPKIKLFDILNSAVTGETAAPINPITTPWKNPPIPLFSPSWYGLINIP